jgi:hypothetical protein
MLGGEERGEEDEGKGDPYTRWRIRSSKSLSKQVESTLKELKLKDKRGRGEKGETTFAGSRCCSDLCCEKTEDENVERVFIFTEELNRELNDR